MASGERSARSSMAFALCYDALQDGHQVVHVFQLDVHGENVVFQVNGHGLELGTDLGRYCGHWNHLAPSMSQNGQKKRRRPQMSSGGTSWSASPEEPLPLRGAQRCCKEREGGGWNWYWVFANIEYHTEKGIDGQFYNVL